MPICSNVPWDVYRDSDVPWDVATHPKKGWPFGRPFFVSDPIPRPLPQTGKGSTPPPAGEVGRGPLAQTPTPGPFPRRGRGVLLPLRGRSGGVIPPGGGREGSGKRFRLRVLVMNLLFRKKCCNLPRFIFQVKSFPYIYVNKFIDTLISLKSINLNSVL